MKKGQTRKSLSLENFKSYQIKNGNNIFAGGDDDVSTAGIATKRPRGIGNEDQG